MQLHAASPCLSFQLRLIMDSETNQRDNAAAAASRNSADMAMGTTDASPPPPTSADRWAVVETIQGCLKAGGELRGSS